MFNVLSSFPFIALASDIPTSCFLFQLLEAGPRQRKVVHSAAGAPSLPAHTSWELLCTATQSDCSVFQDLPGCSYLAASPNGRPYELQPTLENTARAIMLVLGLSSSSSSSSSSSNSRPPSLSDVSHALSLSQGRTLQVVEAHTQRCFDGLCFWAYSHNHFTVLFADQPACDKAPLCAWRRQRHAGDREVVQPVPAACNSCFKPQTKI